MARNTLLDISVLWAPDLKSIYEVAGILCNIITEIFEEKLEINKAYLGVLGHKDLTFSKHSWIKSNDVQYEIASFLLKTHSREIRKYNKEVNPSINYSRKEGIGCVLSFYNDKKSVVGFTVRLGRFDINSLGTLRISQDLETDFDWYNRFLTALVGATSPLMGSVGIRPSMYQEAAKKFTYPLGWINYFAYDYKISIPDDLPGVEYLHTEKGKYLITTREDFTGQTKEIYEAHKQKLLVLMEEIALRDPRYRRT